MISAVKDGVEDLLEVKQFLPDALQESNGKAAAMPQLIERRLKSDILHPVWNKQYTAFSEEYLLGDERGLYGKKGMPVVVVVHGGGLLTPQRIRQAYESGMTKMHAARLAEEEGASLLEQELGIPILNFKTFSKSDLMPERFGIAVTWREATKLDSGVYGIERLVKNRLLSARIGNPGFIQPYLEMASHKYKDRIGFLHPYGFADPNEQQANFLVLGSVGQRAFSYMDSIYSRPTMLLKN